MNTLKSRSIYKIDGATWELCKVSNSKWTLYRVYRDWSRDFFGTFKTKREALESIQC